MKRNRRITSHASHNRTGAVAVEMALVSPILFLFFLGAIEMTNLNFIRNSAANAVYEGARAALISGGRSMDANATVTRYLSGVGVNHGVKVNSSLTSHDVTVSVEIPMGQNSFGISRFTSGYNVKQSITLKREVPGESD